MTYTYHTRHEGRRKRISCKVYLSEADEARIFEFSQISKIPMGQLLREGALKLIDELEKATA